ncbi:S8 family serine peptidase [Streptomyces sp. WMMC500]|uniref:S8 family peptidase n=1 Tax=Streptomyces sp. WMMC500 TaxID=3015154 RepID=UPI00248C1BF7|nr:S8 family serine peptidase [Streptomyces sp. WMMC500]WBB62447.1 S8 family serine peptidase [Streptomyces sp. WMMC500]
MLAAPLAVAAPSAAAPPSPLAAQEPERTVSATSVTLITGDTVHLSRAPDGTESTVVAPGPGREDVTFVSRTDADGHRHVVPTDAGALVEAGRLDPRLFDVDQLVEFGYTDARRDTIPLIVSGSEGSPSAPRGAERTRTLPSIDGAALTADKDSAATFWKSLAGERPERTFAAPGVRKVWLNGRSKVADEQSNAQIGVPAARAAGYDGSGVTVAVLDTGVDTAHPDLAGVVTETRDFTGSPDGVKDNVGHGTHVASIVAGTGAQSAANEGVAPGADVIAGKVCGTRFCEDAAIIAGMEWAAGKADIVNLSLGTDGGAPVSHPLAQAAESLTAETGTLFVAASGNSGSSYTVSAPASANAALAVGSVGRTDALSSFSSEGPRTGDDAVKPDIAAPGEDIVAARATGTSMGAPVDEHYTAASGTSMASPHVAGTAALLAQARPDWQADRLKAALVGSSAPGQDLGAFGAGAGRVDAARAVTQTVFANSAVSFESVAWPHDSAPAQTETVTYRNEGDAPVTLDLAVSGSDAVSAEPATLTVPAGGTAEATVTLDPAGLPTVGGAIGAHLTAAAEGVSVRTAVGVTAEPESYDVTVTVLDRNGEPADSSLHQSLDFYGHTLPGDWAVDADIVDGVAKVRLPKGDYSYTGYVSTAADAGPNTTMHVGPKITVEKDTALTLDSRGGNLVRPSVADRPDAVHKSTSFELDLDFAGRGLNAPVIAEGDEELYVVPAANDAADVRIRAGVSTVYGPPEGEARQDQYYLTDTLPENVIPADLQREWRTAELGRRKVEFTSQGLASDAELARLPVYSPSLGFRFGLYHTVSAPSTRTDYLSPEATWSSIMTFQRPAGQPRQAPYGEEWVETGKPVAGKSLPETWNGASVAPRLDAGIQMGVYRFGSDLQTIVPMFSPSGPGSYNFAPHQSITATGDTSLQLEGYDPVSTGAPGLGGFGGLPAESSRYTLRASATRADALKWYENSTKTEATWEFTSSAEDPTILPLMFFDTTGDFDGLNRARSGPAVLSVDVQRQGHPADAPAVEKVTAEFSTDDGATWRRAPVAQVGGEWKALVVNPREGFVSLRLSAADAAGDTHSSTVIRAYGIR